MTLAGIHEIAEHFGVTRETVYYYRRRPGFPAPIADLAMGPVYSLEQVTEWKASNIR